MSAANKGKTMLKAGAVSVDIAADPRLVFDLVSDVTRIGELSPECHRAAWIDGATGPTVGARFKGHNKWKLNRWARVCEVIESDPGSIFEFRTVPGFGPTSDSTVWRYDIKASDAGCQVTESYEMVKLPQAWFQPFIRRFMPHHLDMRPHMQQTLDVLKSVAEKS